MRPLSAPFTVIAIALAVASGCGGSDDTDESAGKPLTARELRMRLLTAADLPAGYSRVRTGGGEAQVHADNPECDKFLNVEDDPNVAAEAEAEFQKSASGPFLLEALESYKSVALAEADFARGRRLLDKCGPIRLNDPDVKGFMTLRAREAVNAGDETLAYTLGGELTSNGLILPMEGDIVVVRLGGNGVMLMHLNIGSAAQATAEKLAAAAVRKFRSPGGS